MLPPRLRLHCVACVRPPAPPLHPWAAYEPGSARRHHPRVYYNYSIFGRLGFLNRMQRIHRKHNMPCRNDPVFPMPWGRVTVISLHKLPRTNSLINYAYRDCGRHPPHSIPFHVITFRSFSFHYFPDCDALRDMHMECFRSPGSW